MSKGMARTLLDYFGSEQTKPAAQPQLAPDLQLGHETASLEAQSQKRKRQAFPPIAPDNLPPSYFVSATYDGRQKKAVIKLYEPVSGQIYFLYDNAGHKPYLLTNLSEYDLGKLDRVVGHEGFDHFEPIIKLDPLQDRAVTVTKIICKDP